MLNARRRFLDAGHYRPLLDALGESVAAALQDLGPAHLGPERRTCVLEVGCGEGYYLGNIASTYRGGADTHMAFLGADVSKAAARLAAKRYSEARFIVADTNRRIYVNSGSVGVLLDVFAPRNVAEFARVVVPGGCVVMVIPSPSHLGSIRSTLGLLGIEEDKEARVLDRFKEGFRLADRRELSYGLELTPESAQDLVDMGPNHWHDTGRVAAAGVAGFETEASFVILRLERLQPTEG